MRVFTKKDEQDLLDKGSDWELFHNSFTTTHGNITFWTSYNCHAEKIIIAELQSPNHQIHFRCMGDSKYPTWWSSRGEYKVSTLQKLIQSLKPFDGYASKLDRSILSP